MSRFKKIVIKPNGSGGGKHLRRFSRSIPYFKVILKSPSHSRWQMMQTMPAFVFNDFTSILQQIVLGKVDVGRAKYRLKKYQEALVDMAKAINMRAKRRILEKYFPIKKERKHVYYGSQNGNGFVWAALLPILSLLGKAAATGAVGAATGYATKKIIEST